jgi:RHS repeat-associated protein
MTALRHLTGNPIRATSYTYYSGGSPFAGLLNNKTDGRGVTCTYSYDDSLRQSTLTYSGSLPEQNLTTTFQYEPRGFATSIAEDFASTNTGPNTSIVRSYDPYGQLASESVTAGSFGYGASQTFDAAGRRTMLNIGGANYSFAWQADNALTYASDPTGSGSYSYNTAGLLTGRLIGNRDTTITSRDGEGRPLSINSTVNMISELNESLSWTGDGLLATHTLERGDFTDSRSYAYANLSRRLTQEQLNLNASAIYTNSLTYDKGVAGGPGVLTQMGQANSSADLWKGGTDVFSRVATETNNTFQYPAYGHVNGQSTLLSAWLDNQPVSINAVGTNAMQWRAMMELTPGVHQLKVSAAHPSGFYTAWATNSFTNNIAYQATVDSYDAAGDITNRVWRSPNGTLDRTQTLSWDARGRLHSVTERDANNSGYNWSAVYDSLNRRLQTTTVLVTNGVASTAPPQTINSYFDPKVEFLELGVSYGSQMVWKLYGPDLNGKYGGLNGTGAFDAVSPYLNLFNPVLSDFRGNILGEVTNGAVSWNPARPTGYGAVPGYRPVAFANGADMAQSSAWRGHEVDVTGYYNIGLRPYDPLSGRWLTYDSIWNVSDPNYYTFCGGDPIDLFDSDGRVVLQSWQQTQQNLINSGGFLNNAAAYGISFGITALNAFSFGNLSRNDALADENLSGQISDAQMYEGMSINTAAATAAVVTGGAVAPIAGSAFVASGSPALMYITSGAAAGLSSSTVDIAVQRTGDAIADIPYNGTITSDLTDIGTSTVLGATFGAVTYGVVSSGDGVVYLRTDTSGNLGDYYGQAQSDARYTVRQDEHTDANPNSDFEFEQVGSASPGDNLDFMEQFQITANGGSYTQNPLTPLSNDIRAMSDERFSDFLFNTTVNNGISGTMLGNAYTAGALGTKK